MCDAVHEQHELPLEHEVDLLLALVRVDAPALPRGEHDQVHPEGLDAELGAEPLEALPRVAVEDREGEVGVGHAGSLLR